MFYPRLLWIILFYLRFQGVYLCAQFGLFPGYLCNFSFLLFFFGRELFVSTRFLGSGFQFLNDDGQFLFGEGTAFGKVLFLVFQNIHITKGVGQLFRQLALFACGLFVLFGKSGVFQRNIFTRSRHFSTFSLIKGKRSGAAGDEEGNQQQGPVSSDSPFHQVQSGFECGGAGFGFFKGSHHVAHGVIAAFGVELGGAADDGYQGGRVRFKVFKRRVRFNLVSGGPFQQQVIQQAAQAVDIRNLTGQIGVFQLFRRRKHRRAQSPFHSGGEAGGPFDIGNIKIGEYRLLLLVEHNIGGLDVPVNHPVLVGVFNGLAHTQHHLDFSFRSPAEAIHVFQIAPGQQRHREGQSGVVSMVKSHHLPPLTAGPSLPFFFAEQGHGADAAFKPGQHLPFRQPFQPKHLHRYRGAGRHILGLPDGPKVSRPNHPLQPGPGQHRIFLRMKIAPDEFRQLLNLLRNLCPLRFRCVFHLPRTRKGINQIADSRRQIFRVRLVRLAVLIQIRQSCHNRIRDFSGKIPPGLQYGHHTVQIGRNVFRRRLCQHHWQHMPLRIGPFLLCIFQLRLRVSPRNRTWRNEKHKIAACGDFPGNVVIKPGAAFYGVPVIENIMPFFSQFKCNTLNLLRIRARSGVG